MALSFKQHSLDKEMSAECEVRGERSSAGFLEHAKEEEGGSI